MYEIGLGGLAIVGMIGILSVLEWAQDNEEKNSLAYLIHWGVCCGITLAFICFVFWLFGLFIRGVIESYGN
jgi:hypothetical protein